MSVSRRIRASKSFAILMVNIAIFTDMVLANLVAPVLPFALRDLVGLDESETQQWNAILIAIYGIGLTAGSILMGLIADRMRSKQTLFLWGLVTLALTTVGFAVGRTLLVLTIARLLQGFSSAIVFSVGFAILFETVGKERMGTASGWTSVSIALGVEIGPVIGGPIYDYAGFFYVFLPAFGLLAVDLAMRICYIPPEKAKARHTNFIQVSATKGDEDPLGCSIDQEEGNFPGSVTPCSAGAEHQPLLPKPQQPFLQSARDTGSRHSVGSLLTTPRFLTALLGGLYTCSVPAALDTVLPIYLRDSFGLSALGTAPFFMVMSATLILSPLAGLLADRVGPKAPALLAFGSSAIGLFGLRYVEPGVSTWRPMMMSSLAVIGLGTTLALPPLTADIGLTAAAIEETTAGGPISGGDYTLAYGLASVFNAAGGITGPLYAGFVKDRLGWSWAMTSLSLMALGPFLLTAFFTGTPLR